MKRSDGLAGGCEVGIELSRRLEGFREERFRQTVYLDQKFISL
jgi:hypothetical protein